jgi:prepilin-type N-terminal cleavage/methylation domain-containing protein
MKKAFNLVEISVVLLIIGIIAAMVLKGKELLDVSYYRSEIQKVEKIRNAVFALMAKYNGNYSAVALDPAGLAQGIFDNAQFFDNGLLDESSVKIQSGDNWTVAFCSSGTDNYSFNSDGNYICARNPAFFFDIMCNLEVLLDDQSLKDGFGITGGVSSAYNNIFDSDNKTFKCEGLKPRPNASVILPEYGFLVFK